MMKKGRIHGELRYFEAFFKFNQIKSGIEEEIEDFSNFRKRTQIKIYGIKNHSIWIKIRKQIKEKKLGRIFKHEERENQK